jgi:hypothetical protein
MKQLEMNLKRCFKVYIKTDTNYLLNKFVV